MMTDGSRMSGNRNFEGGDRSKKSKSPNVDHARRIFEQASGAGSNNSRHSDASSSRQPRQGSCEVSRGKQAQEKDRYSPQALHIDASRFRQTGGRSGEGSRGNPPQGRGQYPQVLRSDAPSSSKQAGQGSHEVPPYPQRFSLGKVAARGERARERGPRNEMEWRASAGDRQIRRFDVRHSTEHAAIRSPRQEQSSGRRMHSGFWSGFSSLLRHMGGIRGIWSSLAKNDTNPRSERQFSSEEKRGKTTTMAFVPQNANRYNKIEEMKVIYDLKKKIKEGRERRIERVSIDVEKMKLHGKGDMKEIVSATTGKNSPNQDSCFISEYGAGVFDGVGGQSNGHVASGIAKEFFEEKLSDLSKEIRKLSEKQIKAKLNKIILEGNKKIQEEGKGGKTTLSVVIPRGDGKMTAVNVGDSRVYVLTKDGHLKHITTDDSVLESFGYSKQEIGELQKKVANLSNDDIRRFKEITTHPSRKSDKMIKLAINARNDITQSMGDKDGINPEIVTFEVNHGDKVIITSDGVHDNLSDQEIIDCIAKGKIAEEAAQILVKTSRERSLDQTCARAKLDDTTAVVMEIREK